MPLRMERWRLKVIRAKHVELLEGDFVFPLLTDQIMISESSQVPTLDDQEHPQVHDLTTKDQGD